jgi:hypothetical protein
MSEQTSDDWYIVDGQNKFSELHDFMYHNISSTLHGLRNPKSYTMKLLKQVCATTGAALKDAIQYIEEFTRYQIECDEFDRWAEETMLDDYYKQFESDDDYD